MAANAWADEEETDNSLTYSVSFHGLDGYDDLLDLMQEVAMTVKRQKEPPVSRFLLVRRSNNDQKLLIDALKSKGYFNAEVAMEIVGEKSPYEVVFRIDPQTRYHFTTPLLRIIPTNALFLPPDWEKLGIVPNSPAESSQIIKAEAALVQSAMEQGFPWAKMTKRRVRRDREKFTIAVEYTLDVGIKARLGRVRIQGNDKVNGAFLRRRIPWKPGTPYHPKRLEEARQSLSSTGLFSVVRMQLAKQPDTLGNWPLEVELTERKHRTWRAGGGFSTDRGIVVNGGWEHRNFFNAGERLRTEANLGISTKSWSSSYDKPDFLQRGQKLKFSGKLENAYEEAYENISMELGASLVRPIFEPGGELSLTVSYRLSNVLGLSTDHKETYSTASVPLGFSLDRSNDPLDATEGWRVSTEFAPHQVVTGKNITFVRWSNRGSVYYPWPGSSGLVLAGRAEMDLTYGAEQDDIPVDSRLYAGGGSSVRGYGQQLASPLDSAGKPLGGRSLLALGTEARYRFTDTIGAVGFIDAGRAFATSLPEADLKLLYGTGVGIRYLTPIGPLRLDVAMPLERREKVDAPFQFYMSIGQAF
ncbi:MAG: outer membrane protein assembly factor [Magnetococcales bacterium]|nr:outer membrane protein assembly factor [Magnetococcales bacterium]